MISESKKAGRPIAYSYVRFSTPGQVKGDSLRRQVEACESYCQRNGLDLHPFSYRDLGVSAFKSKNVEKGALSAFIAAVKAQIIPEGSYLVIEQFDRLSRDDIHIALKLLIELVQSGIVIVTLVDEKVWDRVAIKDVTNLMVAIIFMSRANNESATKADRLSKAWGQKKLRAAESKAILTRECPRWLKVNDSKTAFETIDDRVASIKSVFEMKIMGFGAVAIASRANRESWPAPGKKQIWHTSLVGRLLSNRSLLGEYQPRKLTENGRVFDGEPVFDFYPKVIDDATFLRAQAVSDRRGPFPGRRDVNSRNFLQGLLKCACGQSIVRKNKTSKKQPNYARYYCLARTRGLSDCLSIGSNELESAIIQGVLHVAPPLLNDAEHSRKLKIREDVCQAELTAAIIVRDRYAEAIAESVSPISVLLKYLAAAEEKVQFAEKALSETRAQAAETLGEDNLQIFTKLSYALNNPESIDERTELRENLARIMTKCMVDIQGSKLLLYLRGQEEAVVLRLETKEAKLNTLMLQTISGLPTSFKSRFEKRLKNNQ